MAPIEQELEFLEGLLADKVKDLFKAREEARKRIQTELAGSFPSSVEQLLSQDSARLLRAGRFRSSLTPEEQVKLQMIESQINQWRNGCYNMTPEYQALLAQHGRLFQIHDFPRTLCFDLGQGMINVNLGLADVMIEGRQYPLSQEDSARFIHELGKLTNVNNLKQMEFPQIEQTQKEIQILRDEILAHQMEKSHPNV